MVKDENYPINVFMGEFGGIEPVPQFQDLGIDTGLQFQSPEIQTQIFLRLRLCPTTMPMQINLKPLLK